MSLNHIDQQVATKARRLTLAAIHGAEGRMALLIVTEDYLTGSGASLHQSLQIELVGKIN